MTTKKEVCPVSEAGLCRRTNKRLDFINKSLLQSECFDKGILSAVKCELSPQKNETQFLFLLLYLLFFSNARNVS